MTFCPKTNKSFIHQTFGKQPIWTLAEVYRKSISNLLIGNKVNRNSLFLPQGLNYSTLERIQIQMDLFHQPWTSNNCNRLLYRVFFCVCTLWWTHSLEKCTAYPENWYCNNFCLFYEEMNLLFRFSHFRK